MINRCDGIKAMKRGLLAVFLVLTISSASQAGPIGVPVEPFPSIFAAFINSSYNATTGAFTALGTALYLDLGPAVGPKQGLTSTTFRLTATIDKSTGEAISGTLTIGAAGAPPLLISNTLVDFAYVHTSGGALEFLFGGAMLGDIGGSYVDSGVYTGTKPLDVLISGTGTAFKGNLDPWAASWVSGSNTAEIKEDPPRVSEPSTLLLLLLAGAGAGGLFRLRKRNPGL